MNAVRVVQFEALTPAELARWDELQRASVELESPYFRPEYIAAAAAVRKHVEVAVIERQDEPIAFFPFERSWLGIGLPVGGEMSDFHGIISPQGMALDFQSLLEKCGLRAWDFQNVPAGQTLLSEFASRNGAAYFLNLADGFEGYCLRKKRLGSETIEKTQRKKRRMIREADMRFELRCRNESLVDTLLAWKDRRYQTLGVVSPVQGPTTRQLLARLGRESSPHFESFLSVLWAGDEPAAIGLTLRSGPAAHCWMIGFNDDFAKYSPGLILVLELAEAAAAEGVQRLHLGKGQERFKTSLATDQTTICEGIAGSASLVRLALQTWRRAKSVVKSSPLGAGIRKLQPLRYWLTYGRSRPTLRPIEEGP